MAWWGKLVGGAFGYMFGGPLGALLGAALGHNLDRGVERAGGKGAERVQLAFFTATFSVMGHLAKADGRVTRDEIASAEAVMARMQLSAEQKQLAVRLFNEGKSSNFSLDDVLDQFRHECQRRRNLIQMFLEILIFTSLADGTLHRAEREVLNHVSDRMGFSRAELEKLISMIGAQRSVQQSHSMSQEDAYAVLGVDADVNDAELKRAYRRLMSQHHPDKLVSKGLPEEMMKLATEKTQEIKAAYEMIKALRE
ncbi:MAG: co-chaperone DjlA [Gammaproteobacteria bacterium]|nr:co-chaperone DjlA [Gammaproteobacteria bacterium]